MSATPSSNLTSKVFAVALLLAISLCGSRLAAQSAANPIPARISTDTVVLPNHHPQWANPANDLGSLAPDASFDALTLVLARSPQQEQAFRQFLDDQQNPASPRYHHWLTPAQVGSRFGISKSDLAAVSDWLQSQGLRITWIAPSRIFIGFAGSSADLGRAFQTELHTYRVDGIERVSVSSEPQIPAALAPHIKAVRGLYSIEDRPLHHAFSSHMPSPEFTLGSATHYLVPQDFATIYDVPSGATGAGQTIGIVGQSRTDFADFDQFRQKTGTSFANPVEVVPTALGGVDPGPALTAPPSSGNTLGDQLEATLDVTRSASIAPAAKVLLVVASSGSGGIGVDTQYLVQTTPSPAQIINISFGGCESAQGQSSVNFWDTVFQQAAAEGISVFVASGDAGAAGCDSYFSTPPSNPSPNSPNVICSSSYATCVGGTEFNDTASPSQYWNSSNNTTTLRSALSYIPEGAWNEPLNGASAPQSAASGGGVSSFIATPSWQTGTGVPTKRAGRYTPDIAFSSSGHDGYFACFAAAGASCVAGSTGYEFEYFYGTSAAAPDMAGITALLDEKLGGSQGNLNPALYHAAASSPTVFHDVTVASSGVTGCSINIPSMCNNSIPGPTGLSGGEAGFLIATGYDEVTGLGSLDVSNFLNDYSVPVVTSFKISGTAASIAPTASVFTTTSTVTLAPIGGFTGTVTLTAAISTSPSGAVLPPTLSFGSTGSVNLTNASSGTATLTISTTASQSACPAVAHNRPFRPWYAAGGTALACLVFFAVPSARRWRSLFLLFVVLGGVAGGLVGCGGSGGKGTCNVVTPATTPGQYTITVTGASGGITPSPTGIITLTVQ